jgi:hypothetical protein
MNIARKLVAVLGAGVMVSSLSVAGAGAAHAADTGTRAPVPATQAAPANGDYVRLYVYKFNDGSYWITVYGQLSGSVIPTTYGVELFGDDPYLDSWITYRKNLPVKPDGSFFNEFPMDAGSLNEDWGQDEIYAKATYWEPTRKTVVLKTNVVSGDF